MGFEQIVFYMFSTVLVASAAAVITVRNPVHAALFMVLAFFASSALWMLLEAEFLAITLVLVYVGAVMVLFLFVVMMLDINVAVLRAGFVRYMLVGIAFASVVMMVMFKVVGPQFFGLDSVPAPVALAADYSNTRALGMQLYTTYVYPFEIASVILLVAIVAAIALTLRRRAGTKYQQVDRQVSVKRADRVRLVAMKAEERK